MQDKWTWRFGNEKGSLWYSVVEEKYGPSDSLWLPNKVKSPYGSSCWKAITKFVDV
ncbi:hypothetical protein MKW92_033235, partial [Papaver armeniacum]